MGEDSCPICLSSIGISKVRPNACRHYFCRECLEEWINQSNSMRCPCCRALYIFLVHEGPLIDNLIIWCRYISKFTTGIIFVILLIMFLITGSALSWAIITILKGLVLIVNMICIMVNILHSMITLFYNTLDMTLNIIANILQFPIVLFDNILSYIINTIQTIQTIIIKNRQHIFYLLIAYITICKLASYIVQLQVITQSALLFDAITQSQMVFNITFLFGIVYILTSRPKGKRLMNKKR